MTDPNKTPYTTHTFPVREPGGKTTVVTVVKATYAFTTDGHVSLAKHQAPLCMGDEYTGTPGRSSLRYGSDMVPVKTGTDILLNGHVYAPMNRPVERLQAGLKVGRMATSVTVWGDRFWEFEMGLATAGKPEPFVQMPLCYERAFGGEDPFFNESAKKGSFPENPVGTGFRITRSKEALDGLKLPNLEQPRKPIKRWIDKPAPAGFGAIAPYWEPRASMCGTYDDNWYQERRPFLPEDFNPDFYNVAPKNLVARPYLKGGEKVQLIHLHPETKKIVFYLPENRLICSFIAKTVIAGTVAVNQKPVLDTLIIEPDERRFILVFRCSYAGWDVFSPDKKVVVHEQ